MMERNEEGTLARFKALQRDLFEPRVSAHYWDYGAWIEEIETALATSAVRKKPARWFPAPSPPEPEQLPPPWPDPARSMQRLELAVLANDASCSSRKLSAEGIRHCGLKRHVPNSIATVRRRLSAALHCPHGSTGLMPPISRPALTRNNLLKAHS